MPIEAEFNAFNDEAGFRTRFLIPLLQRLGFISVYDNCGPNEFGRDIIFGEIDRFGSVIYHGMQVKYQDSVGLQDSHDLVRSAEEAFSNPFRHRTRGTDERIVSFFVANAGNVSTQAADNFFHAIDRTPYAAHVRLLNGKALLDLDRWATITRVEQVGEVLEGLRVELRRNRLMIDLFTTSMNQWTESPDVRPPIERLWVGAVSHYIQKPVLSGTIDSCIVVRYLHSLDSINRFLDFIVLPGARDSKMSMARAVLEHLPYADSAGKALEGSVESALASLGPLAAV
jgi:hypothetical protein